MSSVSEFNEFKPRLKSPQNRFSIENRLKSNTILSIQYLSRGLNSLNSDSDGLINCSLKSRSLQHKVKKCRYFKVKVCDKFLNLFHPNYVANRFEEKRVTLN